MAVDWEKLSGEMIREASTRLGEKWSGLQSNTAPEIRKLAITIASVADRRRNGSLSVEEGIALLDLQRASSRSMITAAEGISIMAAEEAIRAALASPTVSRLVEMEAGPGGGKPPPGKVVVRASPGGGKRPPGRIGS